MSPRGYEANFLHKRLLGLLAPELQLDYCGEALRVGAGGRRRAIDEAGRMVRTETQSPKPFRLLLTGESNAWLPALEAIVGPRFIQPQRVTSDEELLDVVRDRRVDAAVLDDEVDWAVDVLRLLRLIRRMDARLPVVVVTSHRDRRRMQTMLELHAHSVLGHPVQLEQLLRQIHSMMTRLDQMLRHGLRGPRPPRDD